MSKLLPQTHLHEDLLRHQGKIPSLFVNVSAQNLNQKNWIPVLKHEYETTKVYTKRIERFENAIFKQREEINDRMAEMFKLIKELTVTRTPEKVFVREEARHPITKHVNSISLISMEYEKNVRSNGVVGEDMVEPNKSDLARTLENINGKGGFKYMDALVDQGFDVNSKKLMETNIRLSLTCQSHIQPFGIAEDMLVEIAGFIYPMDLVFLDIKEDLIKPFILGTSFLTMAKEEAGIQLQAEEFDLMVAAADLDKIEKVNANCILMANLQQASTSGTQTDKAPVYDSDGSAEVHNHEDFYDNDIFNMFTQEEQYTELLEPILESHQVPQNDNNVISEVTSVEQSGETVEQQPANVEETRVLYDSLYHNLAIKVEKVNTKSVYQEQCLSKKINALHLSFGKQIMTLNEENSDLNKQLSKEQSTISFLLEEKKNLKSDFKTREDELLDKQIQLEKKIKELDNILVKTDDTTPSVARKFLNEVKNTIVTLQHVVKHRMTLDTHNWSSSAHQALHKIVKDENFPIVNQVNARVQNFEIQFLKEVAKFVGDFKSLAKEADESLAKHKALVLEIEHLLRAVVSQDIISVVQNNSVVDTLNLQTELKRTKERFENYIIKKENEYAKLWNDWKNTSIVESEIQTNATMADNHTMAQMLQAPIEGYEDAIVVPPINANNFELKQTLINLVQSNQFTRRQDPQNHLHFFNKVTSTFRHPEVPNTTVKLLLFPFSLEREARIWLDKEPPRSILTWEDLVSKFINQFFPPSKRTYLRNKITNFLQKSNETFDEAWEHFKD
nr:reverse transcriptase domain-containing protein [Tanacetum cinerariifolium]